jgi:hypothetical protein
MKCARCKGKGELNSEKSQIVDLLIEMFDTEDFNDYKIQSAIDEALIKTCTKCSKRPHFEKMIKVFISDLIR